ncbi:EAL domain-containing protein [Actimicrobium sp. CCC2.4]|uniref:EAL domain-containing protein n=1 Tax=Actimicrobium sp. CCC2.4 TaxID=3048606 RepID=UPI002AC8BB49|nr:EAL domain-containing protein [Actimicrobium sp. CCC2.4]MEB0137154.1 EAL domain-containing protein [Actimicrobium sp. CCC2.4]WPX30913.1 EAL domain-containing protein [Actimicrobium sp. CCC2.4]
MIRFAESLNETGFRIKQDISYMALDVSHCGVLILSNVAENYRVLYANTAFLSMTGYTEVELAGRIDWYVQGDAGDEPQRKKLRAALSAAQPISIEMRNYRKDGSLRWCELGITPFRNHEGYVSHFIGMLSDITTRKNDEELSSQPSRHASLTGLTDHLGFCDTLDKTILASTFSPGTLYVAAIDIDQHQHASGSMDGHSQNFLVQVAAERLGTCLQTDEILSHDGNGSYAFMLRADSRSDAVMRCQAIQRSLAQAIPLADQHIHLTCAFGLARFPDDSRTARSLLHCAGMALSHARETSRNTILFYFEAMSVRLHEEITLESALRNAMLNSELEVHYQAQVNLQTRQVIGVEALARWNHPELGQIAPDRFIPLAEKNGLIDDIGLWVIEQVCTDMAAWREDGLPVVPVAVNVSAAQFRNPLLGDQIMMLLNVSGCDPSMLTLEITEAVLMDDTNTARATLNQLHHAGIGFSLDDFGTGYSSISYLKRFPFKKVIIDRSFVKDLVDNSDDAAIIKAIISMAHTLGLRVLAEGVETEEQCRFLSHNLCDEMQGFLFSKPVASSAFVELLQAGTTLPPSLLTAKKARRTLLLVDDEVNIVASLKRLLRRDDLHILTAHSGAEGLALLAQHPVDVILSDQRMPGMTGVEFLSIAKTRFPETVRIVLSGYTELQSVTDAVNEGDIYKFLTKPWDDTKLRGHIDEAFQRKELADENHRLTRAVYATNLELAGAIRQLKYQQQHHHHVGSQP